MVHAIESALQRAQRTRSLAHSNLRDASGTRPSETPAPATLSELPEPHRLPAVAAPHALPTLPALPTSMVGSTRQQCTSNRVGTATASGQSVCGGVVGGGVSKGFREMGQRGLSKHTQRHLQGQKKVLRSAGSVGALEVLSRPVDADAPAATGNAFVSNPCVDTMLDKPSINRGPTCPTGPLNVPNIPQVSKLSRPPEAPGCASDDRESTVNGNGEETRRSSPQWSRFSAARWKSRSIQPRIQAMYASFVNIH